MQEELICATVLSVVQTSPTNSFPYLQIHLYFFILMNGNSFFELLKTLHTQPFSSKSGFLDYFFVFPGSQAVPGSLGYIHIRDLLL